MPKTSEGMVETRKGQRPCMIGTVGREAQVYSSRLAKQSQVLHRVDVCKIVTTDCQRKHALVLSSFGLVLTCFMHFLSLLVSSVLLYQEG